MFTIPGTDNSPIELWGTVTSTPANDDVDGFQMVNNYVGIDEDVGSGRNMDDQEGDEVAPWFSVKLAVPTTVSVVVQYVVYQTSERELLIGGHTEGDYLPRTLADGTQTPDLEKYQPDFTKSERSSNNVGNGTR